MLISLVDMAVSNIVLNYNQKAGGGEDDHTKFLMVVRK